MHNWRVSLGEMEEVELLLNELYELPSQLVPLSKKEIIEEISYKLCPVITAIVRVIRDHEARLPDRLES